MRLVAAALLLLLTACGSIHGEVRDAATDAPVAGALVEVSTIGWGYRDGSLVWDKETIHRSTSGPDGRFRFPRLNGGMNLRAKAGAREVRLVSLCSRNPQLVRIGGPFQGITADRRLLFGPPGQPALPDRSDPRSATAQSLGIRASGTAFEGGLGTFRVEAPGGAAFVRGIGAIPRLPPPPSYRAVVEVDLGQACGWLFVRTPSGSQVVIPTDGLGWGQDPGEPPFWTMLFAELPVI